MAWNQTSSAPSEPWRTGENLKIEPFHFELAAPARFLPLFRDVEDGIHLTVIFREDMLKRTTIQQFGRELIGVARKLTRDPLAMLPLAL